MLCDNSYDNNRDEFQARVKQSIERCRQEVLNPNADDPHSIKYIEFLNRALTLDVMLCTQVCRMEC